MATPAAPQFPSTGTSFRRTGGQGEILSVRFQANSLLRLTDQITGALRGGGFNKALAAVHEKAAIEVQEGMVRELNKRVRETGRPQREGKRLETALLDPQNREVTANGYWVLRRSWMDRSPAELYWRRIEEGDASTFSSQILFTTNFGKFYGPFSPGGGRATQGRQQSRQVGGQSGYPHMRMIQWMPNGAWVTGIGPFPAYRFTDGGKRAFEAFDHMAAYERAFKTIGLELSEVRR